MNDINLIILVILSVVVIGGLAGSIIKSRRPVTLLRAQFGTEYDHTVQAMGDEKKAQAELQERQNHVATLEIHRLTADQRNRYLADWTAVQSKFVDEPGYAILDADRLIMEVMQMRNYPVSDFEQRAADISVSYPLLVTNYRAARTIALKNQMGLASTEELRQAMIYYHSLFGELLEAADN